MNIKEVYKSKILKGHDRKQAIHLTALDCGVNIQTVLNAIKRKR